MKRNIDDELKKLNIDILKMAAMVEEAIHKSVEALKKHDKKQALSVIDNDKKIDDMEIKIEEEVIDLFALFQPLACDLRLITTGMHINTELERMADLTVNISQRVLESSGQPLPKSLLDIVKLANQAKLMVKNSIDSFVNHDQELAKQVILSDKESNRLRTVIIRELIDEHMIKDSAMVTQAVALLLVARDLERICDHAAAIAEDVIYMINAKVIKHHRELL
ncbi:MAG: phosphate signaling complex protein PhoU [Candidatus Omnitrophica bacterium]|nr:phosphate signaling complex protein PhoU [Candidatus Omnitrophota bacterium]